MTLKLSFAFIGKWLPLSRSRQPPLSCDIAAVVPCGFMYPHSFRVQSGFLCLTLSLQPFLLTHRSRSPYCFAAVPHIVCNKSIPISSQLSLILSYLICLRGRASSALLCQRLRLPSGLMRLRVCRTCLRVAAQGGGLVADEDQVLVADQGQGLVADQGQGQGLVADQGQGLVAGSTVSTVTGCWYPGIESTSPTRT